MTGVAARLEAAILTGERVTVQLPGAMFGATVVALTTGREQYTVVSATTARGTRVVPERVEPDPDGVVLCLIGDPAFEGKEITAPLSAVVWVGPFEILEGIISAQKLAALRSRSGLVSS